MYRRSGNRCSNWLFIFKNAQIFTHRCEYGYGFKFDSTFCHVSRCRRTRCIGSFGRGKWRFIFILPKPRFSEQFFPASCGNCLGKFYFSAERNCVYDDRFGFTRNRFWFRRHQYLYCDRLRSCSYSGSGCCKNFCRLCSRYHHFSHEKFHHRRRSGTSGMENATDYRLDWNERCSFFSSRAFNPFIFGRWIAFSTAESDFIYNLRCNFINTCYPRTYITCFA